MLSRVADSLYWMSRYLERAEHTARLIDVDLQLRLDQSPEATPGRWLRLIEALQAPRRRRARRDGTTLAHTLTLDRTNPSSIVSCMSRRPAKICATFASSAAPKCGSNSTGFICRCSSTGPARPWLLHSHLFFRAVQEGAHLFQGVTDSTMTHGEGWHSFSWAALWSVPMLWRA